jgi:H+/Na+-translocating ferredoxin:NAD+ oxidoreductase subunit G
MKSVHGLWLLPAAAFIAPVYAADYLTVEQAQKVIFPDAQSFIEKPAGLSSNQKKQIKKLAGVQQRWDTQKMWLVQKDGTDIGWFIVDDVIGKHEFITYAAGLSMDGKVIGIDVMSYRETHGGAIREKLWRNHFIGKTLKDPFKLDEDVPNISGGTLSCRNVLDGVKRLLVMQQVLGLDRKDE